MLERLAARPYHLPSTSRRGRDSRRGVCTLGLWRCMIVICTSAMPLLGIMFLMAFLHRTTDLRSLITYATDIIDPSAPF